MMFESSQFDGFVSTQSTQSTDPSPTSAKSRDDQPMYPVTVKQIIEATPSADDKSNFVIEGVDVYNVKLVGMVYNKSERVTDVSFVIDDGTGRFGCNRWVNDSQDTKEVEGLTDESYVRIHGHLKSFQGKKQVVVYAIRPINDYNEIANHFLECVHAHCCNTRLQTGASAPTSASSAVSTPNGHQANSSSQISHEYNVDGLGSIDKMVLDHLQQPSSLEAMESLESEGLVYSTIDEFHYKSTS
ncbi:hypothetical protein BUALT_Bualt12G0059400 [Buddleja alternifolia]|uniref:OB domain-containing protein n=1 Tax=Buddleja alternifolia TaxID=168488 RepID=A0AAV6WVA0_9LAMI|nr:hypothetical protein BUALT_Bualt12G0059400 [Buddleja alternifolia]